MICGCVHIEDSETHTSSRAFAQVLLFEVFSVIPRLAFFASRGGEKTEYAVQRVAERIFRALQRRRMRRRAKSAV